MSVTKLERLIQECPQYTDNEVKAQVPAADLSNYGQLLLKQLTAYLPGTSAQVVYCDPTNQHRQKISQQSSGWVSFEPAMQTHLASEAWLTYASETVGVRECPIQGNRRAYIFPIYASNNEEYVLLGTNNPLLTTQQHWVSTQVQLFRQHLLLSHAYQQQQVVTQALVQSIRQTRHQVQNPLALIELYAAILDSTVSDDSVRSHVTNIHDAVQSISTHLQTLSPDQPQRQLNVGKYDLRSLVTDVLKELEPWLKQKRLTVQYPSISTFLPVDKWQLKQVLTNLLNNALHYSPEGGTLYCHWQVFRQEVLVEIWDEGSGLSDIDLRNLFIPFYSRRPNGNGLGLAIAQQIVHAHGGRLWAKNMPEKGANFSFTLPRPLD